MKLISPSGSSAVAVIALTMMKSATITAFGFQPITITPIKRTTMRPSSLPLSSSALRMSTYDDQLNAYYNSHQTQESPSAETPTKANAATEREYPNAYINPYMNAKKEGIRAPVSPPATATVATPTVVTSIESNDEEPIIAGLKNVIVSGVVFLGLPLWLLLSLYLFGGNDITSPASSTQMTVPSTVMSKTSSIMSNSAATPPAVIVLSQPITKAEVRGLFDLWNDALKTLDPATVAKRYAKDGVLLPTLSDVPRNDFEGIKDYFVGFLKKKPDGKILEGEIYVGNNWAQDAGIYEFTFEDGSKVKARYSFIYVYEDGKWMISHHHSSLMPQEVVRPTPITETQVRNLFDRWNSALATGDPQQVADLYSEDAVLLPTLSDSARYTNVRIADYFVGFLKKKPDGKIVEGNVKIGPNWAQDAGIYEFTFQDGSKTRARYSFVYTNENGTWKIANHHSSIMPEPAVSAMKKVAEM